EEALEYLDRGAQAAPAADRLQLDPAHTVLRPAGDRRRVDRPAIPPGGDVARGGRAPDDGLGLQVDGHARRASLRIADIRHRENRKTEHAREKGTEVNNRLLTFSAPVSGARARGDRAVGRSGSRPGGSLAST